MDSHRYAVLTVSPELAIERRVCAAAGILRERGFLFRSAAVLAGGRQLLDFVYPAPGASVEDRAGKLPGAFLSYAEYRSPAAVVLLESASRNAAAAHQALQSLKGPSLPAARGARWIRAVSPMTMRMYSYVHVPDEEALDLLVEYAFPPQRCLATDRGAGQSSWRRLEAVLSSPTGHPRVTEPAVLLQALVDRCLDVLRVSRLRAVLDVLGSERRRQRPTRRRGLSWPHGVAAALTASRTALERIRAHLPVQSYAGRRLALVVDVAIWLSDPGRWDLAGVAELPSLMTYGGVPIGDPELQMLRAWIAYGPGGERIPLRLSRDQRGERLV